MPLPETSLVLGPHTHPGESEHSKPKVAMLLRLSADVLDALQAFGEDGIDIEFGDIPALHVAGTSFPLRSTVETSPHELYLRTHSTSKPNAPLKLYGNVPAKFIVQQQEVGDKLKGKIREKTQDGIKQRDRQTKFIDTPPTPPTKAKKRKEPLASSMFRNPIRTSDPPKPGAASSSTAPARVASPVPPPPTKKKNPIDPNLRRRVVHCMAIQERSRDQIVKLVAGTDESRRRDVLELLEEIGEQTTPTKRGEDAGSKSWRLKTEAWKEVRPYEWPKLPEQERINLARTGRQKLNSLGIKPPDPLWEHFSFRAPANTASAAPAVGPSRPNTSTPNGDTKKVELVPKRGVSSKEVKEKPRPKVDPKAEIQMKDEAVKARASAANSKHRDGDGASHAIARTSAAAAAGATRKVPGSGFRIGKTTAQDESPSSSNRATASPNKPTDREANAPRSSLPVKPVFNPQPNGKDKANGATAPAQRIRKLRESDAGFGSDSDRESGVKAKATVRREEERRRAEATLKRKQATPDNNDYDAVASSSAPQKKRRVESGAAVPSSSSSKPKDLSLPMKPDLGAAQPRTKIRKDASPLIQPAPLPKINKKEQPPSRLSASVRDGKMSPPESISSTQSYSRGRSDSKSNGATKRRRSPIYTSSSEDEGEIRKPRRNVPLPTPPMASGHRPSAQSETRPRIREPRPLPTDHAGLRARYGSTYKEYMSVFSKMVAQKTKIDNMLRGDGSTTDSDGDMELMETEDLARLSGEYKRLEGELETIRGMFPEAS